MNLIKNRRNISMERRCRRQVRSENNCTPVYRASLDCVCVCVHDTDVRNTAAFAGKQSLHTKISITTNGSLPGNRTGYLTNTSPLP